MLKGVSPFLNQSSSGGAPEELGVPYFIGGSLASAIHGVVRATNDVDIVADLKMEHVLPLKKALQDEFYIDEEMIKEAIKRKSSFNTELGRSMRFHSPGTVR